MSIIRRGKYWHFRFVHQRKTYSKSTGLEATRQWLKDAKRIESEAYHAVAMGQSHLLKMEAKPFNEGVRAFLAWADGEHRDHPATARRIRTSFATLLHYFGDKRVHVLTAGDVEGYKTARRLPKANGLKLAEVTLRHDLHALSGFFQYAMKHNWCASNPVRQVEIPSDKDAVRIHVLSAAEEQAYFAVAAKHQALYDLGRLMLNQGCRPEEVLRIRVEDVNLERGELSIPRGKTSAARRVLTLTAESRSILARRIGSVGRLDLSSRRGKEVAENQQSNPAVRSAGGWVFPGKRGPLVKLNGPHAKALEASGTRFCLYDLRHSFASRCAARGMPLPTLAAILGHASLRIIQRYVHIQPEHMREAMRLYGEPAALEVWPTEGAIN